MFRERASVASRAVLSKKRASMAVLGRTDPQRGPARSRAVLPKRRNVSRGAVHAKKAGAVLARKTMDALRRGHGCTGTGRPDVGEAPGADV